MANGRYDGFHDKAVTPGQAVALEDFIHMLNGLCQSIVIATGCCHPNGHHHRRTKLKRVNRYMIAGNNPIFLQSPYTFRNGRRRHIEASPQFAVRQTGIILKLN